MLTDAAFDRTSRGSVGDRAGQPAASSTTYAYVLALVVFAYSLLNAWENVAGLLMTGSRSRVAEATLSSRSSPTVTHK